MRGERFSSCDCGGRKGITPSFCHGNPATKIMVNEFFNCLVLTLSDAFGRSS